MDKILEALKKFIPADQLKEVTAAVDALMAEAREELEAEFDANLKEAFTELTAKKEEAEKTGYEGYQEAFAHITELRNRLEFQNEEWTRFMNEQYAVAAQKIQEVQNATNSREAEIYDEYDGKLQEMKEYVVDKLDAYLQFKGAEIYENAKRDVLSHPRMAEYKVALDKIVNIAAHYLADEDITAISKLEEVNRQVEALKAQVKLVESRNINISRQNTQLNAKLTEAVKNNEALLTEGRKNEKHERNQNAKNVKGKGRVVEDSQVEVIKETTTDAKPAVREAVDTKLLEHMGLDRNTANLLAGTKKS